MNIYEPFFNYNGHEYHADDGTELLSVTGICKSGLGIYQYKRISAKAEFGTNVHKACQYYDEKDLDESTLDPAVGLRLEQYKLACKEKGIIRLQNEVRRYHPVYLFAGTIDLICKINGVMSILDFKTGKQENWHKWQTAGYAELLKSELGELDRYCLYISDSGYDLVKHDEPNNFREFLALKVVAEIKKNNNY